MAINPLTGEWVPDSSVLPAGYPAGITPTLQDYIQPIDPVDPRTQYTPRPQPAPVDPVEQYYNTLMTPPTNVPTAPPPLDRSLRATLGRAWDDVSLTGTHPGVQAGIDMWNSLGTDQGHESARDYLSRQFEAWGLPRIDSIANAGGVVDSFVNDLERNAEQFQANPQAQTTRAFEAAEQLGLLSPPTPAPAEQRDNANTDAQNVAERQAVTPGQTANRQANVQDARTTASSPADLTRAAATSAPEQQETNWFQTINDTFDLQTIGMNMLANSDSGMSTMANLGQSALAAQQQMRQDQQIADRNNTMLEQARIQAAGRANAAGSQAQVLRMLMQQRDDLEQGFSPDQERLYAAQLAGQLGIDPTDEDSMTQITSAIPSLYGMATEVYGDRPTPGQMREFINGNAERLRDRGFLGTGLFADGIDADQLQRMIRTFGQE